MNRWQLWTTVASGAFAVGAPGAYVGYRYHARPSDPPAVAQAEEGTNVSSPLAFQPPAPIPLPAGDEPLTINPVRAASYDSPPGGEMVVRGNDLPGHDEPVGPPPSSNFSPPPADAFPLRSNDGNGYQPPTSVPPTRSYSARLSDEPQPPGDAAFAPRALGDAPPADAVSSEPQDPSGAYSPLAAEGSDQPAENSPADSSPAENSPDAMPPAGLPPLGPSSAVPSAEPPASFREPSRSEATELPQGSAGGYLPTTPPAGVSGIPPRRSPAAFSLQDDRAGGENRPVLEPMSGPMGPTARQQPEPQDARRDGGGGATSVLSSTPRAAPPQPAATDLLSDVPGDRKLEGAQSPTLSLEKRAPEEIQIGKVTRFVTKVRNTGQVAAHGVIVTDRIPHGTRFVESAPPAAPTAEGILAWELGTLQAGEESTITVDLMPESEGEIGSVAQITFHAQAGVRTIATRPMLTVEHSGPEQVLIGDNVEFRITVSNPGTGVTTGVVVEVDLPEQLVHEGGREIMSDRFDLRPNETRRLDLVLQAVKAGVVEHAVRAHADANLATEHRQKLTVVAPALEVAVSGPSRRYLERQVTYQVSVSNPGTAPAQDVELVAHLPQGLKFIATENKGRYDQSRHAVIWSLEELPAGESGAVSLAALPIDVGEQKLHVEGRASLGLAAQFDHTTVVEGKAELVFTVADESDPIEVGTETAYVIVVTNHGKKAAANVRVAAQLPAELTPLKVDGPSKAQVQGQQVVMEPLPKLGPGEEIAYRLVVQGGKAGDHVVRVQVASDESSAPVTKEESTKVYADE